MMTTLLDAAKAELVCSSCRGCPGACMRPLGIINGGSLRVTFAGEGAPSGSTLVKERRACTFKGDWQASFELVKDASTEARCFSVISNRSATSHRVRVLDLEFGQIGIEAFPEDEGNLFDDQPESVLVVLGLRGVAKAYFPRLMQRGGRTCLCPDCLGDGGGQGFKVKEGEALVLEPGAGIALRAVDVQSQVAVVQIRYKSAVTTPASKL